MNNYIISDLFSGVPGNAGAIGHQFLNWLVGYEIAEHYNLKFVHTPFAGNHTQVQIDIPVREWEHFLNFGKNEINISDLGNIKKIKLPRQNWDQARVDHECIRKIINQYKDEDNILFECPDNQFFRTNWNIYKNNRFKQKYWEQRDINPIDNFLFKDQFNIAVHIRRGDVSKQKNTHMFVPNEFYLNVLKCIRNLIPDSNIHIISQGQESDFSELHELNNLYFHLNKNIFQSFHTMVCADILVTGAGSFSVLASYLSNGIKLSKPWSIYWTDFPNDIDIVRIENNADFSIQKLESLL